MALTSIGLDFGTSSEVSLTNFIYKFHILLTKYGKPSKVANAYIQNIMSLPQINNANLQKIHKSLEKLLCSVQTLGTMKKDKRDEWESYAR